MKGKSPMFIILNGVDGCGKDTQFEKIVLAYPDSIQLREPGGTPYAEIIRDVILNPNYEKQERLNLIQPLILKRDCVVQCRLLIEQAYNEIKRHDMTALAEVYLYAASRAQTNKTLVIPAKEQNKMILGRRSVACSMSYQGYARNTEVDMDFVWKVNENAVEGAYPDIEIFLDLPPEVAHQRLRGRTEKQDRLDLESAEFHARTRDGYLKYFSEYCPYPYEIIDASGSIEEVATKITETIKKYTQ
jgi:dTMP kinase